ncbi:MAG TPA: serine/threonine-protein kinase, partial [Byssovorax sp.]
MSAEAVHVGVPREGATTVMESGPRRIGADAAGGSYVSGDVLADKYVLESVLGEGSMGEVWVATNTALGAEVAIKLLRGGDAAGADSAGASAFADHLLHEAQATAKVNHASVVRIFDCGLTARRDPYIVMERLEGEDLRAKLVREGPMTPEAAVQLILPVLQGMQAAHLQGVVHRDLKPENLFLTRCDDGIAPKVLDFGIADTSSLDGGLGATICGTPDYMAPEQITREPKPDHRADIWSVCAVLHEAISGRAPTRSTDADALLPDVDDELRAIVAKGLAPAPCDRFRSMIELGEALAAWLLSRGVEADCQGGSLRARWLYGHESSAPGPRTSPVPPASAFVVANPAEASTDPLDARFRRSRARRMGAAVLVAALVTALPAVVYFGWNAVTESAEPEQAPAAAVVPGAAPRALVASVIEAPTPVDVPPAASAEAAHADHGAGKSVVRRPRPRAAAAAPTRAHGPSTATATATATA